MKTEIAKIADLNFLPGNSRIHDEKQTEFLMRRLEAVGQTRPLIVNKKPVRDTINPVLVGNGLLKAMIELKWEECHVIYREHNEQEAIEESLADNRAYELGKIDYPNLSQSLLELDGYNWDMDLVGYKPEEVEEIMTWSNKHNDPNPAPNKTNNNEENKCPKCGYDLGNN